MAVELVMPRLSESMQEGTVVAWLIGDGHLVEQGQEIAEIESDMSTVAWVAPEAGVLRILVPAGSRLRIGQPIGLIDDLTPLPGAATSGDAQRSAAWGPAAQSGWRVRQPEEEDEGETTEFAAVEVPGEAADEQLALQDALGDDIEPATQEHSAVALPPQPPEPPAAPVAPAPPAVPAPPAPSQPVAPRGVTQPIHPSLPPAPPANPWGDAAAQAEVAASASDRFTPEELMTPPIAPPRPPEQRAAPGAGSPRVQASPVARRLANELGLDLAQIEGTGPEGRVVRADIEAAQAAGLARPPMPAGAVPASQSEFTPPEHDGPQPPLPEVEPEPEPEAVVEPEPEAEPEPAVEPEPEPAVEPEPEPVMEPEPVLEPEPAAAEVVEPELEIAAEEPEPEPEPEPEVIVAPAAELDDEDDSEDEAPQSESVTLPAAQPGRGKGEPVVVELSRQGQTIARRMAESKATIPHYALRLDVDAGPILALRTELATTRPDLAPPSINDLVVRATALALRAFPRLNGAYRDGRVEQYPRVNVGIAVDVEDGLPVPVIHDADRLSLGQIAERSAELIEKARANALRAPDVASATFTVSNLGMLGIDDFEAVITPGQAGILTVGRIAERPIVVSGEIVVGQTFRLTLLVDHRAVYGGPAARFLARVRQLLEHPTSLLA